MEIAITTLSQNGQVVIPSEIRKDAHLKPTQKFLIYNENDQILLRPLRKEELIEEFETLRNIRQGLKDIAEGKTVKVDLDLPVEEIDRILTQSK